MRLKHLLFCILAASVALLSRPTDAPAAEARPLVVIYMDSPSMIWNPWPFEFILYSTGEAFAGVRADTSRLRRLQLEPAELEQLTTDLATDLRDVPEDAGSNPNIFDAPTLHLLVWDGKAQSYRKHHSYGYYCDEGPSICAAMQAFEVERHFNYWVHALPRMVEQRGTSWRPDTLYVELDQTSDPLPLKPLPDGTRFAEAPAAMLLGPQKQGDRRVACVPTGTAADLDAVISREFIFQVLPENGGSGIFGVAADRPGTWYIWNWQYATPYPAVIPDIYPVYAGCSPQ